MSDVEKDVKLSLKVMINKERNEVLFAEADNHFTDILLSFLTLPLGRIFKVFKKHYGDELPTIASLSSLYHSLTNLDSAHFVTEGAKQILLSPASLFEDEYKRLKLDITDSPPAEYFYCSGRAPHGRLHIVSMYYDSVERCILCHRTMKKEVAKKGSEADSSSDGVLTIRKASFTISDDLHIFPNEIGLLPIITLLGITDAHKAEEIKVDLGFNEACMTSPTPLSDVILNKTTHLKSAEVPLHEMVVKEENLNTMSLKVTIQKSTGKLLYAQAKEDFIEFLFGFFNIPLGGVGHLLAGKTRVKAINNLYLSTDDHVNDEYFKTSVMKRRLLEPNVVHGCISENNILRLTEEPLPVDYTRYNDYFSSVKFPKGKGRYLERPATYKVTDDLTVTPFCTVSILSSLNSLKIPITDVQELELQIGLKEVYNTILNM
ncbi:uncharacterized protein LOC131010009 [Salvia miltiorrhiza]|uniref:uncharacterized protein LOC131010009 n=1 Tax=Salvia miltiorrhiza TaxID=226208 RepID=UPI0025ABF33D|nr:uncharacterized protein LOC131010009 [Salvia miltiorrhiza]